MLTFAIEPISDCWDEIVAIRVRNWDDLSKSFKPMLERYQAYEQGGWFIQFTARDADNVIRGFAGMYLSPSMHTQSLLAQEDYWFIEQGFRGKHAGKLFYRFVEAELRKRGINQIMMTVKDRGIKKMLEILGYSCVSYQYSKHLSGADSSMTKNEVTSLMEQPNGIALSTTPP